MPAITLSGIPDYEADRAASKNTLAVRFGPRRTVRLAMLFTTLGAIAVVFLPGTGTVGALFGASLYFILLHAALLLWLRRYLNGFGPSGGPTG